MATRTRIEGACLAVALCCAAGRAEAQAIGGAGLGIARADAPAVSAFGKLPLRFEPNQGQTSPGVLFLARGSGYGLYLTASESVIVLRRLEATPEPQGARRRAATEPARAAVVRLDLLGANPKPEAVGREELPGKSHYFLGSDPATWRANVPQYGRVELRGVYPGIDLTYYGREGQVEYDFVVGPGADPGQIRFRVEGAKRTRLDAEGNLVLEVAGGEIVHRAPVVYQEENGHRQTIAGRYVLRRGGEVRFAVGRYDRSRPLVIDPVLVYSTYLGGSQDEIAGGIAVDAAGNAYLTGLTWSPDFPTANPLQASNAGGADIFVAKLDASGGALVYSTYLGGSSSESARAPKLDAAGGVYVTGFTGSADFPIVNAAQSNYAGAEDAFVTKLDPSGSALVYSTYLGGNDQDSGVAIAVDSAGNAFVTGVTDSLDFPTKDPLQPTHGGLWDDAFVTKLGSSGSQLLYSTYLGGNMDDGGSAIAVDASGNAFVAGKTWSTNFPTAQPLQPGQAGWGDGFVAKLNAAGSALVYSTYLGGSGQDGVAGLVVDSAGSVVVAGAGNSADFPTVNPLQASNAGLVDLFVAKMNPAGSALLYSTYLGGSSYDDAVALAMDASGDLLLAGRTESPDFPSVRPLQAFAAEDDAFVAKLSGSGSSLVYSTHLGGTGRDYAVSLATDPSGNAYLLGRTSSTDFPTAAPFQGTNHGGEGGWDVFVTKIGDDVIFKNGFQAP